MKILKHKISKGVDHNDFVKPWRSHFDESETSKLQIEFYNKAKDYIEIIFIVDEKNQCSSKTLIVDFKELRLDRIIMPIKSVVTSLNNYLVLWELENKLIYYKDIYKNEIFCKIEMSSYIWDVISVARTDDLIVRVGESDENSLIYLLYLNENTRELEMRPVFKQSEKKFVRSVQVKNDYLVARFDAQIHLFKMADVRKLKDCNPIVVDKECWDCCISRDQKFFILIDKNKELSVYKLNDGMQQISCLLLDDYLCEIQSSEKYITGINKIYQKFQTFEIINDGV
jgi:hypothetical protein